MWKELQKIMSRAEPELGLGVIVKVENSNLLEVHFPESREVRRYTADSAPLQRFKLRIGQTAAFKSGVHGEITDVVDTDGLLQYTCGDQQFWEHELVNVVEDQGTIEQFFGGGFTHHNTYELRREAWQLKSEAKRSGLSGLVGPRVTPMPHQLFISEEVSRRQFPRVILSDEVGLGKTIEAGLIFNAMASMSRAERVLVITPEPLIHQWVAEMYRRFNQIFSVIDEERCEQELASQNISAFEGNQLAITSMDFFKDHLERFEEAAGQKWDLLIIDEAHHLDWSEEEPSSEWLIAQTLGSVSKGLLLLTATPRQHGLETQFGLLNLVDPERFASFSQFQGEAGEMKKVAVLAKSIKDNGITPEITKALAEAFPDDEELIELTTAENAENAVIQGLIDRHGTGRVLFRNRRERLKGFPKRNLHAIGIAATEDYQKKLSSHKDPDVLELMDLATGRLSQRSKGNSFAQKARYKWIAEFASSKAEEKVLVIFTKESQVLDARKELDNHGVRSAVFHEGMTVVERDKQAASFADPKGPNLLICSEIGGEGRNFQFAKHLVLADIPHHPDLVEQRIGRLDRIGQGAEIEIYVPYIKDSPEEVLFSWYHEGLDSFQTSWNGASAILEYFAEDLVETLGCSLPSSEDYSGYKDKVATLLENTKSKVDEVRRANKESIDLLIDYNSFDEDKGNELLESIFDMDDDPALECFMRGMFDHYGVDYEEFDDRGSLLIKPESLSFIEKFPGIDSSEESVITFDRDTALEREEITFLTHDHPIVDGALSLLLDRNEGVASVCSWPKSPMGKGALVEISFVLEASGPNALELGRYLPIRTREYMVNHKGKFVKEKSHKNDPILLAELRAENVTAQIGQLRSILEPIFARAFDKAAKWSEEIIVAAEEKAKTAMGAELARLESLAAVNPNISEHEVTAYKQKIADTTAHLRGANARLDGIRLIFTD